MLMLDNENPLCGLFYFVFLYLLMAPNMFFVMLNMTSTTSLEKDHQSFCYFFLCGNGGSYLVFYIESEISLFWLQKPFSEKLFSMCSPIALFIVSSRKVLI